jgi:quinoprotein glucose dehydrogenase
VLGPAVFAVLVLIHLAFAGNRKLGWGLTGLAALGLGGLFMSMTSLPATTGGSAAGPLAKLAAEDWTAFGRTQLADRFSPAAQITPENVGRLEVAWTLRTGDLPVEGAIGAHVFEATPLKVGNLVYVCTPHAKVVAADADTGKEVWRYDPKLDTSRPALSACRGVSWFETGAEAGECAKRIVYGTIDARLIAVDALTGKPCSGFGDNGIVQLRDGLGVDPMGQYFVTSPPAIANGVAVIGGFVLDGFETKEPSGVIRAYDATTGKLAWSWDSGAVDENWQPKQGEHYTRGSPNAWTVIAADPELGMIYLPMGNATPDYVGMHRTPEMERYSSSVVALDSRTGARKWHFQTVHHDLWDYDLGSQPVLFDMPMPDGSTRKALAQPTKQGDIYILDRVTGKPLTAVEERPVPKGTVPEERYSPTQPFSVGFPSPLGKEVLEESDMWGMTPLDQLLCRIRFRQAEYTGRYTPPSTKKTIQYPSNFGAMDWGSATIDVKSGALLVNSAHLAMDMQLIPQADMKGDKKPSHNQFSPQTGTPYAANPIAMLSKLGIPCNAPPWGKLTAIDLKTRTIRWQKTFGTTKDAAPFGIAVPGAPNIAGSVATGGGLLFIGAAIDDYIRAYDTKTGDELWRARLPAGGQAAPISYVSERTGKQYIVIAAGGHQILGTTLGDYLIAYALPDG